MHKDLNTIMQEIDTVVADIKSIKIQGATNVAKEAFAVLSREILEAKFVNKEEFAQFLKTAIHHLVEARSTEPMLQNGMKHALWIFEKLEDKALEEIVQGVHEALEETLEMVRTGDQLRSKVGAELIQDGYRVMTHCHSGSVVKVLKEARTSGKKFETINTETRPLYQGRKTAQDMVDIGIPATLITDDMAAYYIDQTTPDTPKVDMVIIGCDAIKPGGNIINKVGSFSIALSAYNSGVPVYVVGSLTKYDAQNKIAIELRDGHEIWPEAPEELNILNFAFDTVPAKFVTGIITRDGVIKTKEIANIVKKKYPWMEREL